MTRDDALAAKRKLVRSRAELGREELAGLLEDLAARVRAGRVTLGAGEAAATMDLPESLRVELEVEDSPKRAGLRRTLELELKWFVDDAGDPVPGRGPAGELVVS